MDDEIPELEGALDEEKDVLEEDLVGADDSLLADEDEEKDPEDADPLLDGFHPIDEEESEF